MEWGAFPQDRRRRLRDDHRPARAHDDLLGVPEPAPHAAAKPGPKDPGETLARARRHGHHVGVQEDTAPRDRRLQLVAAGTAALSVAFCVAALGLWLGARRRGIDVIPPYTADLVLGSLFPVAGAVVLWRRPRNPAGWVLLSAGLVGVSALAHVWASAEPGRLAWVPAAVWFASWTYVPYCLQGALLPLLFPDGRLPSARWRLHVRAVLAITSLLVLVAMFKPDDDVEGLGRTNPLAVTWLPVPHEVWGAVQFVTSTALFVVATPIALVGMVLRTRRVSGRERAQLLWLLLGLAALPVWFVTAQVVPVLQHEAVFALAFACIPASLAIAVLRHSLLDIEVVVHRTVAYAVLTGVGLLLYVGLVALAGRFMTSDGAGPLLAALIVAAAAAGRTRVQSWVDRRLFGSRRDPYAVVQSVGASTAAAAAPGEALQALASAVRDALRLPFVQVLDEDGEVAAESGAPVAGTHVVPVVESGLQHGVLVVGRRSARERLRPEEVGALTDVAVRAGALLRARRLTADLLRSYEEVVQVREQERLRLRRDLHDGVGPTLAGVALQLEGLAAQLAHEPELADRATRAGQRLLDAVQDVRRIVDGLRPTAVEELGLEQALRRLATGEGDPVRVVVDVDLPAQLPPRTEVAVYRIAGEALTNALRHAAASQVRVSVAAIDGSVHVEVVDDGVGVAVPVQRGVGLESMQQRAGELGGRFEMAGADGGGTRVLAVLPADAA